MITSDTPQLFKRNNLIVVGVGEYAATKTSGMVIRTHALGSCVAVMMLDPSTCTVAMAHIALPNSITNPQQAIERPAYFSDTALPTLVEAMMALNASSDPRQYYIKIVGGASVMDPNRMFNVGERNIKAVQDWIEANYCTLHASDVGGNISRSVEITPDTGIATISSPGHGKWYI